MGRQIGCVTNPKYERNRAVKALWSRRRRSGLNAENKAVANILVVDADSTSRVQVARELRELGHDVTESDSAGTALQAAQQRRPDLMVLDWTLPDLAGLEVLTDVKRSDPPNSTRRWRSWRRAMTL